MIYPFFLILVLFFGCSSTASTEPELVYGCTIQSSCNFNSDATIYDASCLWPENSECSCGDVANQVEGCDEYFSYDPATFNYENEESVIEDNDSSSTDYDISDCIEGGYSDSECQDLQSQCSTSFHWIGSQIEDLNELVCCCEY